MISAKYAKNNKSGHVFFYYRKLLKALEDDIQYRVDKKTDHGRQAQIPWLKEKFKIDSF